MEQEEEAAGETGGLAVGPVALASLLLTLLQVTAMIGHQKLCSETDIHQLPIQAGSRDLADIFVKVNAAGRSFN